MKTNHFLCSKRFNKSHQSQFEGQGSFQRLATPLSRVEWFCSCLLLFVLENSRPICPNLHTPKHWRLSVYWHGGFGLAIRRPKFVQRGDTVAHDLKLNNLSELWWNPCSTKKMKNQPFSVLKKARQSKMSKTFAPPPSWCWSPLRADTKLRGGEVLVTKQMMKIYGTMGIYGNYPLSIDMATRYIMIYI